MSTSRSTRSPASSSSIRHTCTHDSLFPSRWLLDVYIPRTFIFFFSLLSLFAAFALVEWGPLPEVRTKWGRWRRARVNGVALYWRRGTGQRCGQAGLRARSAHRAEWDRDRMERVRNRGRISHQACASARPRAHQCTQGRMGLIAGRRRQTGLRGAGSNSRRTLAEAQRGGSAEGSRPFPD